MSTDAHAEHAVVERFSRRSLWVALLLLLLLGGFAFLSLAGTRVTSLAGALLSIAMSAAVVALGKRPGSPRAQRAVQEDELHQRSIGLAQRDALLAVLVAQPVGAYVTAQFELPWAAAWMACATVLAGAIVLLASLLWRDR